MTCGPKQASADRRALDLASLMYRSHLLQHEVEMAAWQAGLYQSKMENARLQAQVSNLQNQVAIGDKHNSNLQARVAALEQLAAIVRKFNTDSSACLSGSDDQ